MTVRVQAFSSDITIQYQYLEGFAGYLGEIGELCSENVMTLMRKVCEKSDLERIAIIAPDGTAHYSSGEVKNVVERDYFKRAMKGERCLSDPLESVVDGETRSSSVCRYIMLVKWQACLAALMMWAP